MEILVIVTCLACISFSAMTMYKVSLIRKIHDKRENLESLVVGKATDVISSVYKENKKLNSEVRSLNGRIKELDIENALLQEKLEKITKQIESFSKVFNR